MDEEDLDWGDTEILQGGNIGPADDVDDGVSLGSESGDEAAVPTTVTDPSSPGAASRTTYSNGVGGSKSPKSSSFPPREPLQRESSSTSISSLRRNDSSSTASPKSRNRRSKSSSVSAPKVIHGLPAKPVVANMPFLPPSHPSLTEATKMSDAAKGKPSSNTSTKLPSSDVEVPLPPDWQVRHPRSGDRDAVYYYNTRTHQSTWTRPDPIPPSSSRSSNQAESVEPETSRTALSYDDRHYRPGVSNTSDTEAAPSHANRKGRTTDTWFGNALESRRDQSLSPSRGRNRSRSMSPPRRSRERGGGRRRRPSRQRNANNDRDRDSSLVQEHDRHWHPPTEGSASSLTGAKSRRGQRHPQAPQDYPNEPPSSHDTYPEREKPNSSHSRRSPPPLAHESRRNEPQEPQPSSTSANTGKRDRPSRFAPSAAPPATTSSTTQDDDAWVPDEFKASASPIDRHTHLEQRESREGRQSRDMYNANDDPTSPSHPSGPSSEQSSSRRKRPPLPPQSMRFREMSKSNGRGGDPIPGVIVESVDGAPSAYRSPQSSLPPSLPSVPRGHVDRSALVRDPPPHQRVSKSSPEKLAHDIPPHYDQLKDGRREREREERDRERPREEGRDRPRERDRGRDRRRDDYADDTSHAGSSTSRLPARPRSRSRSRSRSMSADPSVRAGSGMYVDSMIVDDPPPKAPRSMAPLSPVNMYPNRPGRSPPPMSHRPDEGRDRDRDRDRDLSDASARDGPRSRKDDMQDGKIPGGPRARRGRGGRPLPLSGTNNIPVGTRHVSEQAPPKAPQNHYAIPPPVPPSRLSGANTVPVKDIRTRGYNGNRESSSEFGESSNRSYPKEISSPQESDAPRYAPPVHEREDDANRRGSRTRRRSLSNDEPRQRLAYPEDEPRQTRRWGSPSRDRQNGTDEHRAIAPPPAARDNHRDRGSDTGRRPSRSPVSRRQENDYPRRENSQESGRRIDRQQSPERTLATPTALASSPHIMKTRNLSSIPVPPANAGLPMKPVMAYPISPPPASMVHPKHPGPAGRPIWEVDQRRERDREQEQAEEKEKAWIREKENERERARELEQGRGKERERENEREQQHERGRDRDRGRLQRERELEGEPIQPSPDGHGRNQRPPIKLRRPPPATPDTVDYVKTPIERPMPATSSSSSGSRANGSVVDRNDSDRERRPSMSRQGASLLDRLGVVDGGQMLGKDTPVSLRDRVTVPSKRDREDMRADDRYAGEGDDIPIGDEGGSKRAKKRHHGRGRKGRGRGPAGAPYP